MTTFSSCGAAFVYKGSPAILRSFLSDLERTCIEKGIKFEYEPIMEIVIP